MEEWRDVVGYEDYFKVSNLGRVFGKRSNKVLKLHVRKDKRVTLATKIGGRNGLAITFKVHRLVAEAFIPNPDKKPEVNHKDGNTQNNCVSNLEWSTHSENMQHAFDTGLNRADKGTEDSSSRLDDEAVNFIRNNPNKLTQRQLAEIYGVNHSTIHRCQSGKRYKPQ